MPSYYTYSAGTIALPSLPEPDDHPTQPRMPAVTPSELLAWMGEQRPPYHARPYPKPRAAAPWTGYESKRPEGLRLKERYR